MFSSHSLWASTNGMSGTEVVVPIQASQFTSLAMVPFARFRRSSFANVRMRVWMSMIWSV
jgi:hypothetical protein